MGGSGGRGGGYFTPKDLENLREEAQSRLERTRVDTEVNRLLQSELLGINDRDAARVGQYLDQIEDALRDRIQGFDRLLFGGSVAKHTYVDGLSDVDSLVVVSDAPSSEKTPREIQTELADSLRSRLSRHNIEDISVGRLAVTIQYRDGTKIQTLPILQRSDQQMMISSADGSRWIPIEPRRFAQQLTEVNQRQGGAVVPAIKRAKAVLSNRLGDDAPSGYHVEAMAVDAFRTYSGPRTPRAMLNHLIDNASREVLRPRTDVTGQSRYIDDYLGGTGSSARRVLSRKLSGIAKTMSSGSANFFIVSSAGPIRISIL
jgi:hypothetical protein